METNIKIDLISKNKDNTDCVLNITKSNESPDALSFEIINKSNAKKKDTNKKPSQIKLEFTVTKETLISFIRAYNIVTDSTDIEKDLDKLFT